MWHDIGPGNCFRIERDREARKQRGKETQGQRETDAKRQRGKETEEKETQKQ